MSHLNSAQREAALSIFNDSEDHLSLMEIGRRAAAATLGRIPGPGTKGDYVNDDSHGYWFRARKLFRDVLSPDGKLYKNQFAGCYPASSLGRLIVTDVDAVDDPIHRDIAADEFDEELHVKIDTVGVCQDGSTWMVSREWYENANAASNGEPGAIFLFESAVAKSGGRGRPKNVNPKFKLQGGAPAAPTAPLSKEAILAELGIDSDTLEMALELKKESAGAETETDPPADDDDPADSNDGDDAEDDDDGIDDGDDPDAMDSND